MNTRSIHKHPGRGFIWDNYSNKEISSTVKKVWLWEVSGSWSGQLISQTQTKQLYFLPGSITSQYMGPAYVLSQDEVLACTYHRATEQAEARFPNRKFGLGPGSFRKTATDWCFKRTNAAARTAAAKNSDETAAATRIIFEEVMQKLP